MNLLRYGRESQVDFIERMLRENGHVSAYDLTYNARYDDGSKTGVTRAAGHIWTLRHKRHMDIQTIGEDTQQATYVYRGDLKAAPVHPWGDWQCTTCKSPPASLPEELLGGLGTASCATCGTKGYFRKRAAA